MKKLLLICGLFTSGFSFGADWGEIGETSKLTYYYDVDSVKKIKDYQFEFWQKQVSKNEYKLIRTQVDCIADTYTIVDIHAYKGESVDYSLTNQNLNLTPPPETIGFYTIERVCNYGLALDIGKLNLPKKSDFPDDAEFQVAKFFAFGFQDYMPTENMMNDYFDLMETSGAEKQSYKTFIRALDGVNYLKIKYLNLKNKAP